MKIKTYHHVILTLIALFSQSCAKVDIQPKGLRTDLMRNSDYVGLNGKRQNLSLNDNILTKNGYEIAKVQSLKPIFNWIIDDRSLTTVAYQVLVSDNPKKLKQNKGNIWDSGKILSNKFSVQYEGPPLKKNKVYSWKIRYWENEELSSSFSQPQSFVIDPEASTEKYSQEPLIAVDQKADIYKKNVGGFFLDFKKAAFAKLKMKLTSSEEDTVSISV
ncbi:MAG: hypothetical protein VXW04_00325, partial [Bacteroidota bacterium]|nr:hypothetical protein [Bacteroidota bacterium]